MIGYCFYMDSPDSLSGNISKNSWKDVKAW
jgi:hypothetical protein